MNAVPLYRSLLAKVQTVESVGTDGIVFSSQQVGLRAIRADEQPGRRGRNLPGRHTVKGKSASLASSDASRDRVGLYI